MDRCGESQKVFRLRDETVEYKRHERVVQCKKFHSVAKRKFSSVDITAIGGSGLLNRVF